MDFAHCSVPAPAAKKSALFRGIYKRTLIRFEVDNLEAHEIFPGG